MNTSITPCKLSRVCGNFAQEFVLRDWAKTTIYRGLYLLIPPHILVGDLKTRWNGYTFSLFHLLLFLLLLLALTTYSSGLRIVIGFSRYLQYAWDTLRPRVQSFAWTVSILGMILHFLLFCMSFTFSSLLLSRLSYLDVFHSGTYIPLDMGALYYTKMVGSYLVEGRAKVA